jgi:hypothetical protein
MMNCCAFDVYAIAEADLMRCSDVMLLFVD